MTDEEAQEKGTAETEDVIKMFKESLDVDEEVAGVLVEEGFTTLDEVAYVPKQEMTAIEGFDEEIVEELRTRARDALLTKAIAMEEKFSGAEPDQTLLDVEGLDEHMAKMLASNGIVTGEDLAEQSVDELLEIEDLGIEEERAKELIMAARAPWFADEQE